MKNLMQTTEHYLHFIFIGALFLIYCFIYLNYGDALFIASGAQDWNFIHFNDVKLNFDIWKHDIGGTSGVDNFYLVSLSYWLPIFVLKVTDVSAISLSRIHAILLPIIIIFIFYKICSLFYKRIGDRIFPCALLALGNWNILKLGLTGGNSIVFLSYYSDTFFVSFLAALYFLLKKEILYSGIFIFLGILIHPSMGVVAGGFLIIFRWFVLKENKLYALMVLAGFIGAGVVVELALLNIIFPSDLPKVNEQTLWDAVVSNGHLNLFRYLKSVFLMFAVCILLLATSAYYICENKINKKLILLGLGYLALMFMVYNFGFWAKIPDIMRLQPMRFSSLFLFMILLAVQFPKTKTSAVAFTIFMTVFFGIHGLFSPSPAQELIIPKMLAVSTVVLVGGSVLCILVVPRRTVLFRQLNIEVLRYFIILIVIGITLVSPLLTWSRAVDERVLSINEAIKFATLNIKGQKKFLLWGEKVLMRGELFRTSTHSPTIKPHRLGMYVYNGSKLVYDDEMKRISIMFDKYPESINVLHKGTIAGMQKSFTEKYSEFYKNEYGVTHIVIFSSPKKLIDSVGSLLFENKYIEIRSL